MMEHQLAAMPSRDRNEHASKRGREEPAWQDRGHIIIETQSPICSGDRQQHHRSNGMRPACHAHADSGNQKQLSDTGDACRDAKPEGKAARPKRSACPEWIGRPPVEHVAAERSDHERNRKVHEHSVDRVTRYSHRRTDIATRLFKKGLSHEPPPRSHRRIIGGVKDWPTPLVVTLTTVVLAGCSGPLSTLDPAGPAATSIATLWWLMLGGSAVLLVLVTALPLLSFVRPRFGTGVSWQRFVFIGGVGVPGATLLALLVYALLVGERLLPHPASDVLRIQATGQQWHWSFSYDHAGGTRTSADVMHMPAGRLVDVHVTSGDVIHSFWIPRLAGKIDGTPGHSTVVRIKADQPGKYQGICAEFCGAGHTGMEFAVQVHPERDYHDAIARLRAGPSPQLSPSSSTERSP